MKKLVSAALAAFLLFGCARNSAPVIGITTGVSDSGRQSVGDTYTEAVRMAGAIPVILPIVRDSALCRKLVAMCDGIILTGGEDIDPKYYGEEWEPELGEVNARRDTSDVLYAQVAFKSGKPVLGICRGEQILNVVLGGSLIQDIPSFLERTEGRAKDEQICAHKQKEAGTVGTQQILITPGSMLAASLGDTLAMVNSFHHQAIKDVAPGLTVTARTADGIVEAYEGFGGKVQGTQFHPEIFTAKGGSEQFLQVFRDFTARCKR